MDWDKAGGLVEGGVLPAGVLGAKSPSASGSAVLSGSKSESANLRGIGIGIKVPIRVPPARLAGFLVRPVSWWNGFDVRGRPH